MALPKSSATPRTIELHSKVEGLTLADLLRWPAATPDDLLVISQVVLQFSEIDLHLRNLVELLAHFEPDTIPKKWRGKVSKMKIGDVEDTVQASRWVDTDAINLVREDRKLRNLIAHFALRRFPNDDAFVFMTKSDGDARRASGVNPRPGMLLIAVGEASEVARKLVEIRALNMWATDVARDVGSHHFNRPTGSAVLE